MTTEAKSGEPPDTGGEAPWSHILPQARSVLTIALLLALLTGVIFPFAVIGISQLAFPSNAHGSLLRDAQGDLVGAEFIGQRFAGDEYFQPRPSAAGADGYDAAGSSGLNLGPSNPDLKATINERAREYRARNGLAGNVALPADAVTTSASGLDPHISPANAYLQVRRVAKARGLSEEAVSKLVERYTDGRWLGFLGEPRVNVLRLNLALDEGLK